MCCVHCRTLAACACVAAWLEACGDATGAPGCCVVTAGVRIAVDLEQTCCGASWLCCWSICLSLCGMASRARITGWHERVQLVGCGQVFDQCTTSCRAYGIFQQLSPCCMCASGCLGGYWHLQLAGQKRLAGATNHLVAPRLENSACSPN